MKGLLLTFVLFLIGVVAFMLYNKHSGETPVPSEDPAAPKEKVIPPTPEKTDKQQTGVEKPTAAHGQSVEAIKARQEQHNNMKAANVKKFEEERKKPNNPYNIFSGRNCYGSAYKVKIDIGNATIDGCKARCTAMNKDCDGFTFNLNQNRCWLWQNPTFKNANGCKGDGKYQVFAKKD